MKKFNCIEGCGECCRYIDLVDGLRHLQNGDGICKYLVNNRCSIYKTRPELCRYDALHEIVKDTMTLEEYDKIAVIYCEQLQNIKLARGNNV